MARYTHWKEAKVALNIIFCFVVISAAAQSPALKSNINYSCQSERLELVIDPKDQDKIKEVLTDYVVNEEAPPSQLDKAANYLADKLPLKK